MRNNYVGVRYSIRGRRRWGWQTRFVSFLSSALEFVWFVVSEAILKQASYYSTKYLKYESFGILFPSCFSDSMVPGMFYNSSSGDTFCLCHLWPKPAQDCFLNQSFFPLACEVFRVQKSSESSDTSLKTWQRPLILLTNTISLPRKGHALPTVSNQSEAVLFLDQPIRSRAKLARYCEWRQECNGNGRLTATVGWTTTAWVSTTMGHVKRLLVRHLGKTSSRLWTTWAKNLLRTKITNQRFKRNNRI